MEKANSKKRRPPMKQTTSPVALVTGASSGIGRASAQALVEAGYRVFGTSRKASRDAPLGVTMLVADVTDDASVEQLVAGEVHLGHAPDRQAAREGVGPKGAGKIDSFGADDQTILVGRVDLGGKARNDAEIDDTRALWRL